MKKLLAALKKSQDGMTIVEGLMGLLIVSMVALTSVTALRSLSKGTRRSVESCRLHNIAVLSRIRSIGSVSDIANFTPLRTDRTSDASTAPFPAFFEETMGNRWPAVPIASTSQPPVIANSLLISGYMNTLQGLYNSGANFCSSYGDFPGTKFVDAPTDDFKNQFIATHVKIVPYNLDDGTIQPCYPPPLYLAPRGNYADSDTNSALNASVPQNQKASLIGESDLGFAVTVITEFKSDPSSSAVENCATEERFQFHRDAGLPNSLPSTPVMRLTGPVDGNELIATCSPRNTNSYDLEIKNPPGTNEAGVVFVCRDQSVKPTAESTQLPVIPSYLQFGVSCKVGNEYSADAPPGPQMAVYIPSSPNYFTYYADDPEYLGMAYGALADYVPNRWVACDTVTLCGIAPDPANPVQRLFGRYPGNSEEFGYRLHYSNLPSGCRIRLQVATLDTAGNSSPDAISTNTMTNNSPYRIRDTPIGGVLWDVPTPRCNHYCGYWPTGYFTCAPGC